MQNKSISFFSGLPFMMLTLHLTWPMMQACTPFILYLKCNFNPRVSFSLNTVKPMSCLETSAFPCLEELINSLVIPILHSYHTPRCLPVSIHRTILLLNHCWKSDFFLKSITATLARRIEAGFHRLPMCIQGFQSFSFLLTEETFSFNSFSRMLDKSRGI